uniref:Transcription factor CBF/NF-Y/archaeal histone domain-containing protein n=1 Tax=Brassica oleracea var. oleracea TaxID=109376 RepID=A0A0D3B5R8_BRAOL
MKRALLPNGKIGKMLKTLSKNASLSSSANMLGFSSFLPSLRLASDKCQKEKRKTVNGEDLLWAMRTLGFEDYLEPLKLYTLRGKSEGSNNRDAAGGVSREELPVV